MFQQQIPSASRRCRYCPEKAMENAKAQNKTLEEEIALLVLHGVLHILGYDHAEPNEKAVMKKKENNYYLNCIYHEPTRNYRINCVSSIDSCSCVTALQKQRSRESVQLEPKPLPKKEERGSNSP